MLWTRGEQCVAAEPDRAGELVIDSIFGGDRSSESSLSGLFSRTGTLARMKGIIDSVEEFAESTLSAYQKELHGNPTPDCAQTWYLYSMLKGSTQLLRSYRVLRESSETHLGLGVIARAQMERLFKASYATKDANNAVRLLILEARGELDGLRKWTKLDTDAGVESRIQSIEGELVELDKLGNPSPGEKEKLNVFDVAEAASMERDYRTAYSYFSKNVHGMYISDGSRETPIELIDWYCLITSFGCSTFLAEKIGCSLGSASLFQSIQDHTK